MAQTTLSNFNPVTSNDQHLLEDVVFVVTSEGDPEQGPHIARTIFVCSCAKEQWQMIKPFVGKDGEIEVYGIFKTFDEGKQCMMQKLLSNTKEYNRALLNELPNETELHPTKSRVILAYFGSDTTLLPGFYGVPIFTFFQLKKKGYVVRLPTMEEIDQISFFPGPIPVIPQVLDVFNELKTPGLVFATSTDPEALAKAAEEESVAIVNDATVDDDDNLIKMLLLGETADMNELVNLMTKNNPIPEPDIEQLEQFLSFVILNVKQMRACGKSDQDITTAIVQIFADIAS